MIDWRTVSMSAIWIFGLSELLATLSYAYWLADFQNKPLRQTLSAPPFRLATTIGIFLLALGLSLTVETWWQKIGWIGVIVLSGWEGLTAWQAWREKE